MNYWLIKSEPNTYSWHDLEQDGSTFWDGVRNYQARNNLREMKVGDQCLYYHSVNEKSVVGIAEVIRESYQDPSTDDDRWIAVGVKPILKFKNPVSLAMVKEEGRLAQMVLVKNSRLSVQPVTREEFDLIVGLSES